MSRTSSDQRLFASALPKSEMPSGPGNISGKSVRTVADQLLDMVIIFIVLRHCDDDEAFGEVENRHRFLGEGDVYGVAVGPDKFQHIARAEIVQGADLAQHPAFAVAHFQADQI